jgi:hypothetical protein
MCYLFLDDDPAVTGSVVCGDVGERVNLWGFVLLQGTLFQLLRRFGLRRRLLRVLERWPVVARVAVGVHAVLAPCRGQQVQEIRHERHPNLQPDRIQSQKKCHHSHSKFCSRIKIPKCGVNGIC